MTNGLDINDPLADLSHEMLRQHVTALITRVDALEINYQTALDNIDQLQEQVRSLLEVAPVQAALKPQQAYTPRHAR
jgi:CHASE3 domain sensor protein